MKKFTITFKPAPEHSIVVKIAAAGAQNRDRLLVPKIK